MIHLLNLEWKKQRHYILFKVLVIAYAVLLPAVLMIGKKIEVPEDAPFNPQTVFYVFPSVWGWLGYVGNWLVFFVFGFLGVLLLTSEHSYRTLRQNVISGLHRHEFFLSKLYFIGVIAFLATLYYSLCALVIGMLHTETIYFSTIFKDWDLMPLYFLMGVGYMSFGLLVGALIKRTGIALFVFLAYSMFGEPVIRWALHLRFFAHKSMLFYPLNAMEDLCPLPFAMQAKWFMEQNKFSLFLTPAEAVTASLVYTALFFWLTYRRLQNSDL
jgi:hypothetical protein